MTTAESAADQSATLPLRDVVLFSSGVGYFQRAGTISGNVTIPLAFRTEQINDILKSLVLLDDAGTTHPVTYTTKDSVTRRLQRAGLSLPSAASLGNLLQQFQGVRLQLEVSGATVEGRLVSVHTIFEPLPHHDQRVAEIEIATVLTNRGLRSVALNAVTQIHLLDDQLQHELEQSLALLAGNLDDQRHRVYVQFVSDSTREVRAGYLQEMPVWKTSYRLVLEREQAPYLQGWAIVENTTDDDWHAVNLSLIAGQPISFTQDLFQPLYVARLDVPPQVIGSAQPRLYAETLESAAPAAQPMMAAAPPRAPRAFAANRTADEGAMYEQAAAKRRSIGIAAQQLADSGVTEAASSARGDLFEYAIAQPVTLPKQQAALVPIVSDRIDGARLSVYDPAAHTIHALHGFLLKNNTPLHLAGGPITVFQDGIYAGDAQISNIQPDEARLITYAIDLDLVIGRREPGTNRELVAVTIRSGVLQITRKHRRVTGYTIRNKSEQAKIVLALQPTEPEWTLVAPTSGVEQTRNEYRVRVEVAAQATSALEVVLERPITESIALLNADFDLLGSFATSQAASEELRAVLGQLVTLRRTITDLQAEITARDEELAAIHDDQARIRQNMEQLERTSGLYQQYVQKLADQEERLQTVRAERSRLRAEERAAQQRVRAFVDGLTLD